jgi:hypothetical protein
MHLQKSSSSRTLSCGTPQLLAFEIWCSSRRSSLGLAKQLNCVASPTDALVITFQTSPPNLPCSKTLGHIAAIGFYLPASDGQTRRSMARCLHGSSKSSSAPARPHPPVAHPSPLHCRCHLRPQRALAPCPGVRVLRQCLSP